MRAFGLVGLLLALGIALLMVRREMTAKPAPTPALIHFTQSLPPAMRPSQPVSAPGNVREQSQLLQQQVQQAVENATQQPLRNAPSDAQ